VGQGFSVNAAKLQAGSQEISNLQGRCEVIAGDAADTLSVMAGNHSSAIAAWLAFMVRSWEHDDERGAGSCAGESAWFQDDLETTYRQQVQQEMTALTTAAEFFRELDRRHVTYELRIVRDEALMMSVALPGERWEIEFFDDGRIELERFVSQGVVDAPGALTELLAWFDE
jgi:hypothetical protein